MEVKFAFQRGGIGIQVIAEMDLVDAEFVTGYEQIAPGIGLLFDAQVWSTFTEGGIHIKQTIIKHYDKMKAKLEQPKVLFIRNAIADLVSYQPIAFAGATVM